MELGEIIISENGQKAEAWVRWKGDVEVLLEYVSPAIEREARPRIVKQVWKGHQKTEDQIDEVALRDWYCSKVIKGMRGLTKAGQPFEPTQEEYKRIWDGNHDFGLFVVQASRALENFL
jgi:hypothetical protein